jgi:YD repeat-containing protein
MDVALKRMRDKAIRNIPIERTASLVTGTTEKVIAASLTLFQPLGTGNVAPWADYRLGRGVFDPSYVNAGTYTSFVFDEQDYILESRVSYDADLKNVVTTQDGRGNVAALHYGYEKTTPIAEIANASAGQVVYEGFEAGCSTGYSFGITGTGAGWTGEKSLSAVGGTTYTKTGIKYSGVPAYRFFCRTNSGLAGTTTAGELRVELVQSGTVKATTGPYPSGSSWNLFEVTVDASALANADFELRFRASANVLIDDVTFFPSSATVSSATYQPGIGKTSSTDARGATVFYQYDQLGRLTHVLDQNKDIRERKRYTLATVARPAVSANFSAPHTVNAGQAATFSSSNSSCLSGIQFKWYVGDQEIAGATTKDLTYTFPSLGTYLVKHTATHDGEINVYQIEVNVQGPLINVGIALSTGELYTCGIENNTTRTFTASVSGCSTGLVYEWQMSTDLSTWKVVGTNSATYSTTGGPSITYYRCRVMQGCGGPEATSNQIGIKHDKCCNNEC